MTTTITVSVTQEDIKKGTREDCTSCPVALALGRWLGEGYEPDVTAPTIYVREHGFQMAWKAPAPDVATEFIRAFDNERTVKPFSFMISVPADLLKPELRSITV